MSQYESFALEQSQKGCLFICAFKLTDFSFKDLFKCVDNWKATESLISSLIVICWFLTLKKKLVTCRHIYELEHSHHGIVDMKGPRKREKSFFSQINFCVA